MGFKKIKEISGILLLTAFLVVGIWAAPSAAFELCLDTGNCLACHPNTQDPENDNWKPIHMESEHPATLTSGPVLFFPDRSHDDAAWAYGQPSPHFAVDVVCATCHTNDLRSIHGKDCFACHNTDYYSSVEGSWQGGCQQGACHMSYHDDSSTAHLDWEDATNGSQDCNVCHEASTWNVPSSNCLNCHATYGGNDNSPPVTSTNAIAEYIGAARIKFKITDNGKVGVGRTYYKLDSGKETGGMEVLVTTPGDHTLEYWSVDQAGNIELLHKWLEFTIIPDTTAPVTTLTGQSSYTNVSPKITVTAEDDGELGVKETYCSINGGTPVSVAGSITIPMPSTTTTYELACWSVDYSGNIELVDAHNTKGITINVIASAPLTLIWWNSDTTGSPCPSNDNDAAAFWKIERVNTDTGATTLVKNWNGTWNNPPAYASCWSNNNWSGINTENLLVTSGPYKYKVSIKLWYNEEGYADQWESPPYLITLPAGGAVIRY